MIHGEVEDSCVVWSPDSPQGGIQFSRDFAGVTFDMGVRAEQPLSVKEMETVLMFSLSKFGSVEIVVNPKGRETAAAQIQLLADSLSPHLAELLEDNGIRGRRLYIEVPMSTGGGDDDNSRITMAEVEKLATIAGKLKTINVVLEGVHTVWNNWESSPQQQQHQKWKTHQFGKKSGSTTRVGLSVRNCSALVNAFPHSQTVAAELASVNYILCETKPIPAEVNDRSEFARSMDAQLYLKTAISNLYPNLSVYFRLSSVPCCGHHDTEETKTENGLRFLNDVNQFAGGNKIKYFLVQAVSVSPSDRDRVTTSWWKLDDYRNLGNASAYIDKEAEIHSKPTWRPVPKTSSSSSSSGGGSSSWTWVYYTLGAFGLIVTVLLVSTAVLYISLRQKSRLLSELEVQEFLNGSRRSRNNQVVRYQVTSSRGLHTETTSEDCSKLKFDVKYSLAKEDFQFSAENNSKTLGSGNFGRVVEGVVRGTQVVAVKIPHEGCTKDSFKSMLMEVKVMSYMGSHKNVVSFLRAYIGEISNGIIYIATELCENGSLLGYLRRYPRSADGTYESTTTGCVPELIKFGLEIASGMEYIASRNIIHGDLSTRNVLLNAVNSCKITDFGLSRKLYEYTKYVKQNQEPLPWRWMAYESLTRMEFTTKSDVWSYGITLWEIFSLGDTPYPGMSWTINFADEIRDGLRQTKPELCNAEIYNQMRGCWNLSPEARPTFTSLWEFMEGILKE